jgi:hypothetical protein
MGCIKWLSQKGDERIEWDPEDAEQTVAAEAKFKELKEQGYNFFETAEVKGKQIKKFSKKLGTIIAAPGPAKSEKQAKTGRAQRGGPNDLIGAHGLGRIPAGFTRAAQREMARR